MPDLSIHFVLQIVGMDDKIEQLFETQSLTELKAVERKFHSDIERKRQDLRLLVGYVVSIVRLVESCP